MLDAYYKTVRTAQSYLPSLADRKYQVQRWYRRTRGRPFERDFLALRHLPTTHDDLFLDVGANRGQSIDAILLTTDLGEVWSFEPNPILAARLQSEHAESGRVTVHCLALGRDVSDMTLYVPSYRGYLYDGLASLDEDSALSWLRDRVYGFKEEHLTTVRFVCETRPLDSLACAPTFIKVDVQGFELDVVLGAQETIARSQPIVLIESPDQHICDVLGSLGLAPYAFDGASFAEGRRGDLNTFFMSASRHQQLEAAGAAFD